MGGGDGGGARLAVRRLKSSRMQRSSSVVGEGVLRRVRRGRASRGERRPGQVPIRAHPPRGLFTGYLRHSDLPGGGEQRR